jgi:hypothetical protein
VRALAAFVTELILGHERLGEESNYNYSKLKRKGKKKESNTSYFIINARCVRVLAALLIIRTLNNQSKKWSYSKVFRPYTGYITL